MKEAKSLDDLYLAYMVYVLQVILSFRRVGASCA